MPVAGTNIGSVSDVQQAQIEAVRKNLQDYFESTNQLASIIEKDAETEQISQKLYRIPVRKWRGGVYQKFNADAGDMGNGSGQSIDKLTAGFIYTNLAYELSQQSIDTTQNKALSRVNNLEETLAYAINESQVYDDMGLHGDGTGKLTNSGSAYTTGGWSGGTLDTMTFAGATDTLGINNLRPGMSVLVYNSAGTAARTTYAGTQTTTSGPIQIDHIDASAKVVYFNGTIASGANSDLLAFAGTSATLQSFQSGWPLTGDSFRHGIRYANDATGSNYYLGQLKSGFTQLLAKHIAAGNNPITFQMFLLVRDQIGQDRDPEVLNGLVGIAHFAQRTALLNSVQATANWLRTDVSQKAIDLIPKNHDYYDIVEVAGMKVYLSKRQDKARVDLINPKTWGRTWVRKTDFHEVGGRTVFEGRMSTGNLKATQFFAIIQAYDYWCADPGAQGYLDGLTLPSGYA